MEKFLENLKTISRLYGIGVQRYLERIKAARINIDLSDDTITSGVTCLVFLLTIPSISDADINMEIIDRCIDYVMIYMIVDHTLDSKKIDEEEKAALVNKIKKKIRGEEMEERDLVLELYDNLTRDDAVKVEMVKKLFQVVLYSVEVQKRSDCTIEEYYRAMKLKGGYTIYGGVFLVYGDILSEKDLMLLGECAQLVDDMMDCRKDLKDGIDTYCTKLLEKEGNLDSAAMKLQRLLSEFPKEFEIFRRGFLFSARIIVRKSEFYSSKCKRNLGRRSGNNKISSKILEKRFRNLIK